VDILVAAYWGGIRIDPGNPGDPDRDRFILSKGHAGAAMYATLAFRGFFAEDVLDGYAAEGQPLQEHPGPRCVPGIEAATGSLGHGLSIGCGMALAARLQRRECGAFVVVSDGECNEGSVWEAAMFAAAQRLGRLRVFVDYNKWQATGRSNEVLALSPLQEKWCSFGWEVVEADGHDGHRIMDLMKTSRDDKTAPLAVVCHTTKGKGVSFMEDDNNWHYRIPTEEEVRRARTELGLR